MCGIMERILRGDTLVADGAMGTMLFQRGLKTGECPEKMNLDCPEILGEIAKLYLQAGSDIIQTNTFGGSPLKLAHYGLDSKTKEINATAVRAVRDAIGDSAYLSASCGPCGGILKPYGDTEPEEVTDGFKRQLAAVVAEGVDMICIETMIDLAEAKLAVAAARMVAPSIPVSVSMTFDSTPNGFFTIMGATVEQAAKGLLDAGADILGSNCGNGSENMVRIAVEFRKHTTAPLIIQSNAGLPELKDDVLVYSETPEFIAEQCLRLLDCGVNIVGGCCGTTPDHIAAIRHVVDQAARS
jgi:5-methyltetrahydrofolate--homocysteine methyltransferase